MKYYVGTLKNGESETFLSDIKPTEKSHGKKYKFIVGPFRTKNGAIIMAKYGKGNPHLQHVADAEKMAKNHPEMIKEDVENSYKQVIETANYLLDR